MLADLWLGPTNAFVLATALLGATLFVWMAAASSPAALYGFAALFGLANGAAQGIWVGTLAAITPDPATIGVRFGMVCTLTAFATLAGPPTAAALIQASAGRYAPAQAWAGSVILLAAAVIAVGRVYQTGWRLWVKV